MVIVKVYRVFPSNCLYTVSSQQIQIHSTNTGDSGEVVTPFMRVGTYPTRYFATLGPLGLQPPFIEHYNINIHSHFSAYNTGQVSNPLHLFTNLQSPKFLLNSRYPLFCYICYSQTPFLPKLQSQFAEFLQYYYYSTLTYSVYISETK